MIKGKTEINDDSSKSFEIAREIIDVAENLQAQDILLLDVRGICSYADAFVLLSGASDRQINSIKEAIDQHFGKGTQQLLSSEGDAPSGWILMDYSDVIVHIFSPSGRNYYGLEHVWRDAKDLVRIQ
jgi:ribosome-associated protein